MLRAKMAVGAASLLAAGVIGGVTAVAIADPGPREVTMRTVSDHTDIDPTASPSTDSTPVAEPTPTAGASPSTEATATASPTGEATASGDAATEPASSDSSTTTDGRSQTVTEPVTEPEPTASSPEPTPSETARGTSDLRPDPGPPLPTIKRCWSTTLGHEVPCPREG